MEATRILSQYIWAGGIQGRLFEYGACDSARVVHADTLDLSIMSFLVYFNVCVCVCVYAHMHIHMLYPVCLLLNIYALLVLYSCYTSLDICDCCNPVSLYCMQALHTCLLRDIAATNVF